MKWQPTPVFLPGKSHGMRILVGYSPWGRKESDTAERLHFTSLPVQRPMTSQHFGGYGIWQTKDLDEVTSNAKDKSLRVLVKFPRVTTGCTRSFTPLSPAGGSLSLEESLGLGRQVETLGLPQISLLSQEATAVGIVLFICLFSKNFLNNQEFVL